MPKLTEKRVIVVESCERCKFGAGGYEFEYDEPVICQYDIADDIHIDDIIQNGGIHPDCPLPKDSDFVSKKNVMVGLMERSAYYQKQIPVDTSYNQGKLIAYDEIKKFILSMPGMGEE